MSIRTLRLEQLLYTYQNGSVACEVGVFYSESPCGVVNGSSLSPRKRRPIISPEQFGKFKIRSEFHVHVVWQNCW